MKDQVDSQNVFSKGIRTLVGKEVFRFKSQDESMQFFLVRFFASEIDLEVSIILGNTRAKKFVSVLQLNEIFMYPQYLGRDMNGIEPLTFDN